MPYFADSQQLQEVLGGFFNKISEHPAIGKSLMDSKLVIRFSYDDPKLSITADCRGDAVVILFDDTTLSPEIEMWMKADIAHQFWFGKLNLLTALTRKQMVAKGPIPKILKLLPAIKPAYSLYPEYLAAIGKPELVL
jgi:hypothetical protein